MTLDEAEPGVRVVARTIRTGRGATMHMFGTIVARDRNTGFVEVKCGDHIRLTVRPERLAKANGESL